VIKENHNAKITTEEWKKKYIFIESYEIFFVMISFVLQEWLANLVEFKKFWKDERVTQWTLK